MPITEKAQTRPHHAASSPGRAKKIGVTAGTSTQSGADPVTRAQIQSLQRIGRRPEDIADHLGIPLAWIGPPRRKA